MGYGDEPFPAEVIEELRGQLADAELSLSEVRRDQRADGPRPPARPLIHLKLIEVMREVTFVAKTGMNTQQNYPFRGIDGVMNEVGPAMRKVGVLAIPTVLQYKNRDTQTTGDKKTREVVLEVRYDFYAEDGSSVSAVVWGESLDFSDKGTAKALSVALRIALLQTLMLPTQEPTTDDNGHYHTRAGTATLSGWTAQHGRTIVTSGTAAEVIDFWPAIVESSSIEASAHPGEGKGWLTWGEMVAKRIAAIVDEEQSPEALRELYGKLKAADMIALFHVDESGRYQLGDLVVERGKTTKLNRDKAFDHCIQLITSAANHAELENALVHVMADLTDGPLTQAQYDDLLVVANERRLKMPAGVSDGQGAPREFLDPQGDAWATFCSWLDTQNRLPSDIVEALEGQWDKDAEMPPAAQWGLPGLLRVIDAIKRNNKRDRTISDIERVELIYRVQEQAELNGIIIPDANL